MASVQAHFLRPYRADAPHTRMRRVELSQRKRKRAEKSEGEDGTANNENAEERKGRFRDTASARHPPGAAGPSHPASGSPATSLRELLAELKSFDVEKDAAILEQAGFESAAELGLMATGLTEQQTMAVLSGAVGNQEGEKKQVMKPWKLARLSLAISEMTKLVSVDD
ncbi:unnamed protein product [Mycena citricolor]|uniref:Uncharacterized protein n=1 Tax=Mycena citricolor TaxID=2018698 RepID=A0AAD2GZW2_9AGAR|nr:unnamed protein product [Mycena citricolor]